jgi:hypothetical protein
MTTNEVSLIKVIVTAFHHLSKREIYLIRRVSSLFEEGIKALHSWHVKSFSNDDISL